MSTVSAEKRVAFLLHSNLGTNIPTEQYSPFFMPVDQKSVKRNVIAVVSKMESKAYVHLGEEVKSTVPWKRN